MADAQDEAGSVTDPGSEQEDIPGLCDESSDDSDSDSDYEEPEAKTCKKGDSSDTEEEDLGATASHARAAPTPSKRDNVHLKKASNVHKRSRLRRNTTHAAKLECVDVQEIKKCLSTQKCSCGENCFAKLQAYKNRAVLAIEKLRLQRFSGKSRSSLHAKRSQPLSPTPGWRIIARGLNLVRNGGLR